MKARSLARLQKAVALAEARLEHVGREIGEAAARLRAVEDLDIALPPFVLLSDERPLPRRGGRVGSAFPSPG